MEVTTSFEALRCNGAAKGDLATMRACARLTGGVASVPATYLHVAPQVELHSSSATDYLDSCAGIVRSKNETIDKLLASWKCRNVGAEKGEKAIAELQHFCREYHAEELVKWVRTLPFRDGEIDMDSLGMSVAELAQEAERQSASNHEVLEVFLEAQDNVGPEQARK